MILEYIIANAVIGGIATGIYFVIKKLKKPVLCKSCKYLVRSGGGVWKYECTFGDTCKITPCGFDNPPEYCVHYKTQEDKANDH